MIWKQCSLIRRFWNIYEKMFVLKFCYDELSISYAYRVQIHGESSLTLFNRSHETCCSIQRMTRNYSDGFMGVNNVINHAISFCFALNLMIMTAPGNYLTGLQGLRFLAAFFITERFAFWIILDDSRININLSQNFHLNSAHSCPGIWRFWIIPWTKTYILSTNRLIHGFSPLCSNYFRYVVACLFVFVVSTIVLLGSISISLFTVLGSKSSVWISDLILLCISQILHNLRLIFFSDFLCFYVFLYLPQLLPKHSSRFTRSAFNQVTESLI